MNTLRIVHHEALADLSKWGVASRWIGGEPGLHSLDFAPGASLPVLLISPGITMPAAGMAFVAKELTDLVRPIVLDNRGRGLSQVGEGYRARDYCADLERVIDALEIDQPIVMGHSMGARGVALLAATQPELMRAAIVVDPPLSGPGRGGYPTSRDAFLDQVQQAQGGVTAQDVAKLWPTWPDSEQELRARWLASCDLDAVERTHEAFESEDFFDFWPQARGNLVFMYGESSPVVTDAGAAECAAANPVARMVVVPGAGHMTHWDAPEASLTMLREVVSNILNS